MTEQVPSKEKVSEERLRNTRAWAAARPDMSGSAVIVAAIDELLQMRKDWKTICEAADAMPTHEPPPASNPHVREFAEFMEEGGVSVHKYVRLEEYERQQRLVEFHTNETAQACQQYREVLAENTTLKRAAHEPCARLHEGTLRTEGHCDDGDCWCYQYCHCLSPVESSDSDLVCGNCGAPFLEAAQPRPTPPPRDELLEIAREVSTLDCFYTGDSCPPACECVSARAGRAIQPTSTKTAVDPEMVPIDANGRPVETVAVLDSAMGLAIFSKDGIERRAAELRKPATKPACRCGHPFSPNHQTPGTECSVEDCPCGRYSASGEEVKP